MTRISQLVDSAHRLRKEISCPELEFGYNKYKEDVISLRDNVNNDICVLETFGENWNLYGIEKSKLLQWINSTEADIGDFDPVSDMQKFWVCRFLIKKMILTVCVLLNKYFFLVLASQIRVFQQAERAIDYSL